jgi:hypothetical protein
MSDPGQKANLNASDMQILLASQKSYVGSSVVVFLLYCLCYIPGLIFNIMWLGEARKTKRLTGVTPSGTGCLWIMFIIGLIPWVFIGFIFFGTAAIVSQAGHEIAARKEAEQRTPSPAAEQAAQPPSPTLAMVGSDGVAFEFEIAAGDTLIALDPILVFDKAPGSLGTRSAMVPAPLAFTVKGVLDGDWLEVTAKRHLADSFNGWIRVSELQGKELDILLDGETLADFIPSTPPQ